MEISEADLKRLLAGAFKAGMIRVVGLAEYDESGNDSRAGREFADEQVRRWIAEGDNGR